MPDDGNINSVIPESHISKQASPIRVLLVEDNEDDVFLTRRAFSSAAPDITLDAVSRGQEAIAKAASGTYDVAIIDYKLPDMDGMEVLRRIAGPDLPVIIATGRGDQKIAVEALKSGAEDYIVKEEGYLSRLPQAVKGAVRRSRLDKENRRLIAETARQASILEAVLDTDPGAIAVLRGPDFRFELTNPSFRNLVHASARDNLPGTDLDDIFNSYKNQYLRDQLDAVYTSGEAVHLYETPVRLAGDQDHYFHIHMIPLGSNTEDGERDIAVIMWDTTKEVWARREAVMFAQQAEAQRAWLQTVIDQMPEGVYIAEAPSARVIFTNRAADRILGRESVDDLSAPDLSEVFGLYNLDGTLARVEDLPLQRAIWNEEAVTGRELLVQRDDGTEINVLLNSAPLYDTDGKLVAGVVVFQDITHIREAERMRDMLAEQADAQRNWLQAVIDQMPTGVYIAAAPDGHVLFTNRAADELFGPPRVESINNPETPNIYRMVNLDGSRIEPGDIALATVLRTGTPVSNRQTRFERADGTFIDLLSNTAPLYDAHGQMIAAVTVFQDITRLKEVERIKDEFTSIASHELRTPLTSLKAAGQLLLRRTRQGEYPPHGIGLINTIVQQADRMTRLIEELLDVSRIQSGKLPFKLEKFDLATLVTEAVETSQMSHPEYTFDVHADEQVLVRADKDRISQVLSNLLDNAVKYNTPGGSVRVGVRARENAQEAELTVTDRGIGFEPQQSEEVFERFARLGNVANHSRGMGLGLFICRQIMEAHGGNIEAHSDGPGKGATFTVTLPLAHAD